MGHSIYIIQKNASQVAKRGLVNLSIPNYWVRPQKTTQKETDPPIKVC